MNISQKARLGGGPIVASLVFCGVTWLTICSFVPSAYPLPDRYHSSEDPLVFISKAGSMTFPGGPGDGNVDWINEPYPADVDDSGRIWLIQGGTFFNHFGDICAWTIPDKRQAAILKNPKNEYSLWSGTLSPNWKVFAGHCRFRDEDLGMRLVLWDMASGEILKELDGKSDVGPVVFSNDSSRFLVSIDNQVQLFDVTKLRRIAVLDEPLLDPPHVFQYRARMFFDRMGRAKTIVLGEVADLQLWDVEWQKLDVTWVLPHKAAASSHDSMVLSGDGSLLAVPMETGMICLWSPETKKEIGSVHASGAKQIWPIISPDNRYLAISSCHIRPKTPAEEKNIGLHADFGDFESLRYVPVTDLYDLEGRQVWSNVPVDACAFTEDSKELIARVYGGVGHYSLPPHDRRLSRWAWFWLGIWICSAASMILAIYRARLVVAAGNRVLDLGSANGADESIMDVLPG